MTGQRPVLLTSLSAAMDGGFTAISDVSQALGEVGASDHYRLIGGVSVMLHIQRLGIDLPLRATGDADFGVPLHVLKEPTLVAAIEAASYTKVMGNRWERQVDERRVAAVDLLVPAYRSRARHTVKVGDIVTTEVPGLAEALRRPAVTVDAQFQLTDGSSLGASVALPDAVATLALKAGARTVRNETRDAEDLWRCLEIAAADGVTPDMFAEHEPLQRVAHLVIRELGPGGSALPALTAGLQQDPAARLRTRLRALLAEVVGNLRLTVSPAGATAAPWPGLGFPWCRSGDTRRKHTVCGAVHAARRVSLLSR